MLRLAEAADQSSVSDGVSLPDEIKRREDRLAAIAAAKAKIEERAKERYLREQAEYARVRQFCHKGVGFSRPAIGFMLVSGFFRSALVGARQVKYMVCLKGFKAVIKRGHVCQDNPLRSSPLRPTPRVLP